MIESNPMQTPGTIDDIYIIRHMLVTGKITYEQAKIEAAPIITHMNQKAAAIAKKYGMRPKKISFAALMR